MGCSYHHQISHVGNTTFPSFSSSLLEVSRSCPKGMETFFRKVIRNKDSVSPSPKLTVNVPENRPAFPQKERQIGKRLSLAPFFQGQTRCFFSEVHYIYIYSISISLYTHTLGEKFENPMDDPLECHIDSRQWVSGVATVGFGDLAPVTSWEA